MPGIGHQQRAAGRLQHDAAAAQVFAEREAGVAGVELDVDAAGGIGLIRQQFDVVGGLGYTANDLGYNVGGGVLIFPSAHVGIRGDIRYFRSVGADTVSDLLDLQPGAFNFTRATVGVTFRY